MLYILYSNKYYIVCIKCIYINIDDIAIKIDLD